MTKDYFNKENGTPPADIPVMEIDKEQFQSEDSFVWLGHSTILGNLNGVTFITDPMLSERASPVSFAGPKRFDGSLTSVDKLPRIDIVLITHNHYDHLDKDTVLALKDRVKKFFVPLDNRKILTDWGVEAEKVEEFDWSQSATIDEVSFKFYPSQHFSGRGVGDRDEYLWGSWGVRGTEHSIYISGDSGYGEFFKAIGEDGGFSVASMECGAYNKNWSEIHMLPEESVQASKDVGGEVMLPMHWAGFDLSTHPWNEPIERALAESEKLNQIVTTPRIGEVNSFKNPVKTEKWWREVEVK
jgi:L-ascorbate metabolism protein UlaG (beta-lactamase superfamily)